MAQRALIAFADELEHARALRDVVIRLRQPARRPMQSAAHAQKLTPGAGHGAGVDALGHARKPGFGFLATVRGQQGLGCDQIGLNGFCRRRPLGRRDLIRQPQRFIDGAAARCKFRFEHADRPFIPFAGLRAVSTVRFAGLAQIIAGRFVSAAHQRDLCERVEHRARNLMELSRTPHLQRAVQHLFGALELSDVNENLPQRGQTEGQAAAGTNLFLQRGASFGQRERVLVTMLNQGDVCLVVADDAEHVVGLRGRGEPFGLSKRCACFFDASALCQHGPRQRVHEGQIAAVAGGMQRRRRLRDVLADDGGVADLFVAEPKLVMGQPDRF